MVNLYFPLRTICSSCVLLRNVIIYNRGHILSRFHPANDASPLVNHSTHSISRALRHNSPYTTYQCSQPLLHDTQMGYSHVEESSDVKNSGIVTKINNVLESESLGRLFAVVQIASKQRKITAEDIIIVEGGFTPDIGDRLKLDKVLMVGSKDFSLIGRPMLNPDLVRIEATVIEKTLSHSKVRFFYTPRKRNKTFTVWQYFYTMLQINSIELTHYDQSKPSVIYDT